MGVILNIHNGDSTAGTAKRADIPGEHLAWREALVCGPTPGHLPETEFIKVRAIHLANAYAVPLKKCEAELRTQHEALARFSEYEEIVLWFEHDLFCQINLIYLLHWFAQQKLGKTRLSLICIGEFPGIEVFHGLGELNEEQLTSLFPQRREISTSQLVLGAAAWRAYSAPDPAELISLLDSDLADLPFLGAALKRHVRRFPSTRNGLGRIENVGLELVAAGHPKMKSLFPAFMRREPAYGFGDAQFYLAMRRLATARNPVLRQKNGGNSANNAAGMLLTSFEITEQGEAIMTGKEDFVIKNGIDLWLGGVHLKGTESPWRWDEGAQELLMSL